MKSSPCCIVINTHTPKFQCCLCPVCLGWVDKKSNPEHKGSQTKFCSTLKFGVGGFSSYMSEGLIFLSIYCSAPGSRMMLICTDTGHCQPSDPFPGGKWHLPSYFRLHLQQKPCSLGTFGPQFQLVQQRTSHYKHLGNRGGEPIAIRMVGMTGTRSAKIASRGYHTAKSFALQGSSVVHPSHPPPLRFRHPWHLRERQHPNHPPLLGHCFLHWLHWRHSRCSRGSLAPHFAHLSAFNENTRRDSPDLCP